MICSIRSAIPYAATELLLVSWVGKKEAKKVIIKKPDAIQSVFKDAGKACVIISFWYLNFGTKSLKEILGDTKYERLVKSTKTLHNRGNLTYAKIAGILAEEGWVQPSTLQPFHKSQIMRLINQ